MDYLIKKDLISVIVPVYNVDKYLDRCVKSIVDQSYSNLEIILVDDGSTDSSSTLCDQWKNIDDRIVVVHKQNGGLSSARNAGIDIATGKYFIFIDSDDFVHHEMFNILLNAMLKNQSDMVFCDFQMFSDDKEISFDSIIDNIKYDNFKSIDLINRWYDSKEVLYTVSWNKIYRRELFDSIRYPNGKLHEDEFTTYKLVLKSKNVTFVNEKLYFYYQRNSSITGQLSEKRLDVLDAYKERINYSNAISNTFFINSCIAYLDLIINYYYKFNMQNNKKVSKYLNNTFKKEYKKVRLLIGMSVKKKFRFNLFKYNKKLYKLVFIK